MSFPSALYGHPDLSGLIVHNSDFGLLVLDRDEKVVVWNRWLAVHSGIGEEEAHGRKLTSLWPTLTNTRVAHAITEALCHGRAGFISHAFNPMPFPLRALAGDDLTDATLSWICSGAGAAGPPLQHLLRRGEVQDSVPLGLVLALLVPPTDSPGAPGQPHDAGERHTRELGMARLAHRWQGTPPTPEALRSLGSSSTQVVSDLMLDRTTRDQARHLLHRADALLSEIDLDPTAIFWG